MENLQKWSQWTRYIFSTPEAKAKPWRKMGINHMSWAAKMLGEFEAQCTGYGDPSDYTDITNESPEAIIIARESASPVVEVEASALVYHAPMSDRERFSRSRINMHRVEVIVRGRVSHREKTAARRQRRRARVTFDRMVVAKRKVWQATQAVAS